MITPTLGGWLVYVLREASGSLSLEEALHVIMDSMKEYFPSQSVAVILIDEDTNHLQIKISRQISYTFVKQYHRDGPSAAAEKVVLEQQPMLLNNLDHQSDAYRQLKMEHDYTSAVLAPIVKNQRGVGYIFCDREDSKPFTESDLLHLQVLGYLIGHLMEKFELIQSTRKLSSIDDASGALQYKAFIPALAGELQRAKTHGYPVTLALFAVDAFRVYVETHGIRQAHALLAEVAKILKGRIRDMDILARFGADQFILCLSGVTGLEAARQLEALRDRIRQDAVGQGDRTIQVTVGASTLDRKADWAKSMQDIMATVGKRLVEAKASGKLVVAGAD